ncbi:MAG: metallophosphoesterase family protein [Dehalococcoidales bacterium]|nr:metallophosphoesterase family protein [Dehalococcoidales bacterium]
MRIGVVSDTHVAELNEMAAPILAALAGVDLIIHAGDFTGKALLDGLKSIAPVKAVCGNMDSGELRRILPQKELFLVDGKRFGLTHGSGAPWGITGRVRGMFDDVDIIIYGHSHQAYQEFIRGSLLFNPGCARDSFGILTVGDEITAEIVKI